MFPVNFHSHLAPHQFGTGQPFRSLSRHWPSVPVCMWVTIGRRRCMFSWRAQGTSRKISSRNSSRKSTGLLLYYLTVFASACSVLAPLIFMIVCLFSPHGTWPRFSGWTH